MATHRPLSKTVSTKSHSRKLGVGVCVMLASLLFFGAVPASAVRYQLPAVSSGEYLLENTGGENILVYQKWPIRLSEDQPWETSHLIGPRDSVSLKAETLASPTQVESSSKDFKVLYRKGPWNWPVWLPLGVASRWITAPLRRGGHGILKVTNTSTHGQDGRILLRGSDGRNLWSRQVPLAGFESQTMEVHWAPGAAFSVEGDYVLNAFLETQEGKPVFLSPQSPENLSWPPGAGALFVLSNESRDQSFVVRIEDEKLISEAREQIRAPGVRMPRILVGQIGSGNKGYNRNMASVFRAPWSWHVEKIFRFAELGSIACDGSPQLVEDLLPAWLGGRINGGSLGICFWGYRIIEEIVP